MKLFERPLMKRHIATALLFAVLLPALVAGGVFGGATTVVAQTEEVENANRELQEAKIKYYSNRPSSEDAKNFQNMQSAMDNYAIAVRKLNKDREENPPNPCGSVDFLCTFNWIIFSIINGIYFFVQQLFLLVFGFVIWITTYNNFLNSPVVEVGWVLVRDIANLFFILILLIIAFSTILGVEKLHYKQHLFKLLLMAVVINFSKMITGLMIDFSQVVLLTFANSLTSFPTFSANLGAGPAGFNVDADPGDFVGLLIGVVFGIVMLAFATVVVGVIFVMLLARILMLWMLTMLSPLPFLLSAFPQGQQYAGKWWGELSKNLVGGPVLVFFLWLTLSVQSRIQAAFVGKYPNMTVGPTEMGTSDALVTFAVTIGLLIAGLKFAQESGAAGAGVAGGALARGRALAKGSVDLFLARGGVGKTLALGLRTPGALLRGGLALRKRETWTKGLEKIKGAPGVAVGALGRAPEALKGAGAKGLKMARDIWEEQKKWQMEYEAASPAEKKKMLAERREKREEGLQKWSRFLSPEVIKQATEGWMKREKRKVYPEAAGELEDTLNLYANRLLLRKGEKTYEGETAREAALEERIKEMEGSIKSPEDLAERLIEAMKSGNALDITALDRLTELGNNGDDVSRVLFQRRHELAAAGVTDLPGKVITDDEGKENAVNDQQTYQSWRKRILTKAVGREKAEDLVLTSQKQLEAKGISRAGLGAIHTDDETGKKYFADEWQGSENVAEQKAELSAFVDTLEAMGEDDAAKNMRTFVETLNDDTKFKRGQELDEKNEAHSWITAKNTWGEIGFRKSRGNASKWIENTGAAEEVDQYAVPVHGSVYGQSHKVGKLTRFNTPASYAQVEEQVRTPFQARKAQQIGLKHNVPLYAKDATDAGLLEGMPKVDWKQFFDQYEKNAEMTMVDLHRFGFKKQEMQKFVEKAREEYKKYQAEKKRSEEKGNLKNPIDFKNGLPMNATIYKIDLP